MVATAGSGWSGPRQTVISLHTACKSAFLSNPCDVLRACRLTLAGGPLVVHIFQGSGSEWSLGCYAACANYAARGDSTLQVQY